MTGAGPPGGLLAPLRHGVFRRIWSASLFSNFGLLINGVGAGWAMTTMSGRAQDVALVQAALMLPYMLFSIAAGAIADTYDRRRVALITLGFTLVASVVLALADYRHLLTPALLVGLCFVIGTATAMFAPSWQASVGEQVPSHDLPSAVALNSVSYNIARSLGPAIGGAVVAAAGSTAAFLTMTVCYLPMVAAMLAWRRRADEPRLPPERIGWAIQSGVRYIIHSPPTRTVLLSCLTVGIAGGAVTSLMPLVSRDLLKGGGGHLWPAARRVRHRCGAGGDDDRESSRAAVREAIASAQCARGGRCDRRRGSVACAAAEPCRAGGGGIIVDAAA